jgi:hypothetical protein
MTKQQISDDGMVWLIFISGVFIIGIVLTMIVQANMPKQNCWDLYTTEKQAILHCEVHDE